MLIVLEDFTQRLTATTEADPFNASMPGSRLRELQVSRRARITTISDTPYFGADMEGSPVGSINPSYNVVAVIGYDGAASRNMFRSAHRFIIDAAWTKAGFTAGNSPEGSPSAFPSFRVWDVTIAAGVNTVDQALTSKPGENSNFFDSAALSLVACGIFKQNANDADVRIIASDVAGGTTNFVRADFDLSAGTASAATVGGTFTSPTAPDIVALGDSWYLCRLYYLTGTEDELNVRYEARTPGGSGIMDGDETWHVGPPVQMLGVSDLSTAEYPITFHTSSGPMFNVRLSHTTHGEFDDVSAGWQHCATRNKLRNFDRYSFFHKYAAVQSEPLVRVELWDPDNDLTYIEAGRLIVGRAAELDGQVVPIQFAVGAEETGGQIEADGLQIYRAQRGTRRRLPVELLYNTRSEAFDDYYFMQRVQGRSRQVLVIAEENETKYAQDGMIYGYIDDLEPEPIALPGGRYSWGFEIVETP